MSRRILSALLALVLVAGFAAMSKADVTGSFDLHIGLQPEGTQTEAVKYYIDLQANLQVNVTVSGLTFGTDLGFGTTGVEFAILNLTTNLGALSVFDQFVFATAFGCDAGSWGGQCPGQYVTPISDGVLFVKKRVEMELNIAGITMNNLAIFEDVDFPDIDARGDHYHHHFTSADTYGGDPNTIIYDNVPTFGFGDVITLSGQTVSGITVTNITGICADAQEKNRIKKRSFTGAVDPECAGAEADSTNTTAEPLMAFTVEKIQLEGIDIAGLAWDAYFEFRPGTPVSADIDVSFSVAGLASVTVTFSSDNITNLTLGEIDTVVSADNLTLILIDDNGDLVQDTIIASLSFTLNPNQNPASLSISATTVNGSGLVALKMTLSVSRSGLNLSSTTSFSGSGTLAWTGTSFSLSAEAGALNFGASLSYSPSGFGGGDLTLGLVF